MIAGILFGILFLMLFVGVPIAICLGIAAAVTMVLTGNVQYLAAIPTRMFTQLDSFTLMAVPFFILAGNIMNNGGIARRLVNFAKLFVGWIPGSLAQANIVGNMLFGALSGSSVAAASAMGGLSIPSRRTRATTLPLPRPSTLPRLPPDS